MMTSQVSYQHLPAECADPPPAYTATEMESRNGNLPTAPLQLEQHPHNLILYNHSSMTSSRIATYSKPRDFFVFTVVLLVLCLLCGNIAIMICVFPALIMSLIVSFTIPIQHPIVFQHLELLLHMFANINYVSLT
jgi:hypothetical protein